MCRVITGIYVVLPWQSSISLDGQSYLAAHRRLLHDIRVATVTRTKNSFIFTRQRTL